MSPTDQTAGYGAVVVVVVVVVLAVVVVGVVVVTGVVVGGVQLGSGHVGPTAPWPLPVATRMIPPTTKPPPSNQRS